MEAASASISICQVAALRRCRMVNAPTVPMCVAPALQLRMVTNPALDKTFQERKLNFSSEPQLPILQTFFHPWTFMLI
jgi:hypothetical protein